MAYDTNSGLLARNERKQQPNHPDFTGQCEIGNPPVSYWISGWVKEGKPGSKMENKKFFSLAFKPKDPPAATPTASPASHPAAAKPADPLDDSIPF